MNGVRKQLEIGMGRRNGKNGNGNGSAPSITDVAQEVSVSVGTVSRVMNREPSVNPELRRRVLMGARRLGFVPKTVVRHVAILAGRRHPTMPMGYTNIMTSLIERVAGSQGYAVEIVDIRNLEMVYDCRVDAVIGVVFHDEIERLRDVPNLPIVTVNHPMAGKGIHSVYSDHFEQGVMATRHLVERGHSRIAILAGLSGEWGAEERLRGYRNVLDAAGLPDDESLVGHDGPEPLYDVLGRWVRQGVTAVLNFNDDVGPEVLHILSNVLGLRIGRDISTVTVEDLPLYQYFTPPQTVIRQPLRELAERAVAAAVKASTCLRETDAEPDVTDICLPSELLSRESVVDLRDVEEGV